MIVILPKVGTGTIEDPFRPDTSSEHWQLVEEKESEFIVEILDDVI